MLTHALEGGDRRAAAYALLDEVRDALGAPDARLQVEAGPAAERLAAAAEGAFLLAIGGSGSRTGVRAALARRAPCPLAVVPAVPQLGGTAVICGVRDWADVDTAAVAARLAGALALPLTLMHVLPPATGRDGAPAGALDRPWDDEAAHSLLDGIAAAVTGGAALRVERGTAGPVLAAAAVTARAGLLVVGGPVRGRLGAALTGSASGYLMRRSERPLIVCGTGCRRPAQAVAGRSASWTGSW